MTTHLKKLVLGLAVLGFLGLTGFAYVAGSARLDGRPARGRVDVLPCAALFVSWSGTPNSRQLRTSWEICWAGTWAGILPQRVF